MENAAYLTVIKKDGKYFAILSCKELPPTIPDTHHIFTLDEPLVSIASIETLRGKAKTEARKLGISWVNGLD
ncbi:MAG: hypothetical protein ACYC44_01715 [Patescibacteria group bacterium]